MVILFVLVIFTSVLFADSVPINATDVKLDGPNWQLVPDINWNLHWIDINDPANYDPEPYFKPVTQTAFQLYTRRNRDEAQVIGLNNDDHLRNSNFNPNHPTRFIVHGWNNDGKSNINKYVRYAYLDQGESNVFVVDWGRGANTINYISARNRVNPVSAVVADFLRFLNQNGLSYSTVTIVGHSLGAHIAGLTGKKINRIGNVVALDPALPLFSMDKHHERVHSSDADYVESIQTDIGRLGMKYPVGLAAFYPNWGGPHPGCGWDLTGSCGHSRSWEFFTESINGNSFWATMCQSFTDISNKRCQSSGARQTMGGEPLNRGGDGVFYLETNNQSPFSKG